MSEPVKYFLNMASEVEVGNHLLKCDADFVPPLSGRVQISDYAKKIVSNATRFEAWAVGTLVGLVAAYCNDQENHIAYITSVSVLHKWKGKGIATHLMSQCVEHAKTLGMRQINIEVDRVNTLAIKLYEKSGFVSDDTNGAFVVMNLSFTNRQEHGKQT